MREIRFRAWDKDLSQMYNWGKLAIEDGQVTITEGDQLKDFKHCVPMQYTGLLDKNGVEIYEGDIIAHEVNNMRGAVVWNPASYCYSIDSLDGSEYIADLCDYDWNPEVIGNIYENSELLK